MGLLDVLNGMQNGPRGQPNPSASGGGMSPITMAVLGLLAYKAVKHFTGQSNASAATPGSGAPASTLPEEEANAGGGLGGLLGGGGLGGLGGLLAGGAAGSVLSGGLKDLLDQFQQSGHGDVAKSWVDTGANKSISPDDLAHALGEDRINAVAAQTGMSRDELLAGLSEHLPEVVNKLTPQGRVPTEEEVTV